jgi:hypothetical protein
VIARHLEQMGAHRLGDHHRLAYRAAARRTTSLAEQRYLEGRASELPR